MRKLTIIAALLCLMVFSECTTHLTYLNTFTRSVRRQDWDRAKKYGTEATDEKLLLLAQKTGIDFSNYRAKNTECQEIDDTTLFCTFCCGLNGGRDSVYLLYDAPNDRWEVDVFWDKILK